MDVFLVGAVHKARLAESSFSLGGFLGQNVVAVSLASDDLAAPRGFEPFGGATVGFHLWHVFLLHETGRRACLIYGNREPFLKACKLLQDYLGVEKNKIGR